MTAGPQLLRTAEIPLLILFAGSNAAQEVLPFYSPPTGGEVGPTTQESVHQWREPARHLPEDAPNILIVMLDDAGYGQAGPSAARSPSWRHPCRRTLRFQPQPALSDLVDAGPGSRPAPCRQGMGGKVLRPALI